MPNFGRKSARSAGDLPVAAAKEHAIPENPVVGDHSVAEFDHPDEGWECQQGGGFRVAKAPEYVEGGPAGCDHPAVCAHDVERARARLRELRRHRRIRNLLVGPDVEDFFGVVPPEPGGDAASESSVAVPGDQVAVIHALALGKLGFAKL